MALRLGKLSNFSGVPYWDWRLSDFITSEPDIPIVIIHRQQEQYFYLQNDGKPYEFDCPGGWFIKIADYGFQTAWVVFEDFEDMPKWAQDAWKAAEDNAQERGNEQA